MGLNDEVSWRMKGLPWLIAILVGAIAGGFLLLLLLLGLARVWNGWPAAVLLIGLMFFPAFWVIGGWGWIRVADAHARGRPVGRALLGLDCPRCARAPMSPWRKWRLDGRSSSRCRHCGLRVTNDRLPVMVLLAPLLTALLMAPVVGAVVRGISPNHTIAALLTAGGMVTLFIALTRPFLTCEPLSAPPATPAQTSPPADPVP